jgi:hypothetical protein
MTPEEKVELAALFEEKEYRGYPKFERRKMTCAITGVEHPIIVVKLKLRLPDLAREG